MLAVNHTKGMENTNSAEKRSITNGIKELNKIANKLSSTRFSMQNLKLTLDGHSPLEEKPIEDPNPMQPSVIDALYSIIEKLDEELNELSDTGSKIQILIG